MAIRVYRYTDEQIACVYEFDPDWTWKDFDNPRAETARLAAEAGQPAGIIADIRKSMLLPRNALSYSIYMKRAPHTYYAGITVIVGASVFVETMISTFQKIYPLISRDYHFARTLEEAFTTILDFLATANDRISS